jgi:hypothetical protein
MWPLQQQQQQQQHVANHMNAADGPASATYNRDSYTYS